MPAPVKKESRRDHHM